MTTPELTQQILSMLETRALAQGHALSEIKRREVLENQHGITDMLVRAMVDPETFDEVSAPIVTHSIQGEILQRQVPRRLPGLK